MEKKTIITLIGGLTLSLAAVVAGTLSYNLLKQDTSITNGDNTSYTLKIDKDNGGVVSGSYVTTATDYKVKTTLGNELTLQYVNGMAPGSTASSGCIIQVKKSSGYIYNSSAISNITSISVSYTSSAKPTLTYGDVTKPTSNSQTIEKNTAINISTSGVNYFKLAAGANALYLESITITYSCTPQIPTVTGITATDANDTYNLGDIYKTSNALTVVANISNGSTETLEYDATGESGYTL